MKISHVEKFKKVFQVGNEAIGQLCEKLNLDLTELNKLVYATARVSGKKCGLKKIIKLNEMKIENYKNDLSLLNELKKTKT